MKQKKTAKRIRHLCYKYNPPFLFWMLKTPDINTPSLDDMLERSYISKEERELITLLKENFTSELEAKIHWIKINQEKKDKREEYKLKPITPKQDNKNRLVGSGRSNRNKIRFPKKKRKTAWKRFRKLFPDIVVMYKPEK